MIYIATDIAGKGIRFVTAYDSRTDFYNYAAEVADRGRADDWPKYGYTIEEICHFLRDRGIGFGSRTHRRISREEAHKLVRQGVDGYGF